MIIVVVKQSKQDLRVAHSLTNTRTRTHSHIHNGGRQGREPYKTKQKKLNHYILT